MAGATEALVVVARVRKGEADAARAAVAEHWPAAASPFALAAGTHLARLQVLTPPARRLRGRLRTPAEHVLLAADADAPAAAWLERLRVAAAGPLDAVLGHCAFYPGTREPAAFARWIAANRLDVGFSVIGSPGATTADVRAALALHGEVATFAERTQGLDPAALRAAWRTWRAA
jgi:hypothetical protein